ncbi:MAG TPA: EamA family transporter [Candidatus Limnocylindrales bacterium]|nr:EamA family transporter [Candidatus Limnocylindrales bacterium]
MPAARPSVLFVLGAGMLFGTAGTAQALGPASASPMSVGILRIEIGAIALLLAMPLLGSSPRRLLPMLRTRPMLVTAVTAATYQLCFFAGVSQAGVALGTLVAVGSGPVFAGLLAWPVLGHRPTRGWLVATAACVTGLTLLALPDIGAGSALGLVLALGAGLCSAGYNIAAKIQLDRGATALEVPAGSFALGGVLLLPILVTQPLDWLAEPSGVAVALYLGVATMAIANVLHARGIRGLTPGPVTTLMLADPVVATILGVVVLGETLAPVSIAGVLLVLAGLLLQGFLVARTGPGEPETVPVL